MASRQLPQSFTAGRPLNLDGTTYDKGDSIPNDVVGGLKNAAALVARRWIIPGSDHWGRDLDVPTRPTMFRFFARERKALVEGKVHPIRSKTVGTQTS